jgi:CheY-like chemotaxis protein
MLDYLRSGRVKMDPSKNEGIYTFHDSCNNARSCGLTEEPRELLRAVVPEFREMFPNRAENYCCTGGGGAMSMAEYTPRRLQSAKVKADQLKATGATHVVTSCHNCEDGLNDLIKHYGLEMKVTQLVTLVADALVIEKPVAAAVPAAVGEAAEAAAQPKAAAAALAGRRILVADDEPDVTTFLSAVFEDHGAQVEAAASGEETLAKARRSKPDLITLDLNMPGQDGGQVFAALKADAALKDIPVCIVTGKPELRGLIYDSDLPKPEGYLDKPVTEEDIITSARKILELGKRTDE